jgi:hypothetical protein
MVMPQNLGRVVIVKIHIPSAVYIVEMAPLTVRNRQGIWIKVIGALYTSW